MIRTLLVLACLLALLLALWAMRAGWRHREERQAALLPPLPTTPDGFGVTLLAGLDGVYVGTVFARSFQDRVVVGGLGARARAAASLHDAGVLVDREGAPAVFIPAESLVAARLAAGLAGTVVGAGGLLVIRWRHGDAELDTVLRADDKGAYPAWVRAVNSRAAASSDGSARSETANSPSLIKEIRHSTTKGSEA